MNLQVPSVLLGYQIGGTLGYKFLSKYRVDVRPAGERGPAEKHRTLTAGSWRLAAGSATRVTRCPPSAFLNQ